MKKRFDLSSYKKLLKLSESGEISLLDENFLKLLDYGASVYHQICYNQKEDYFLLIEEYLNQVISPNDFRFKILEMTKEKSKETKIILGDFQKLEDFTFVEGYEKISDIILEISTLCSDFYETWDGTIEPMPESKFYDLVNNYYRQLQE